MSGAPPVRAGVGGAPIASVAFRISGGGWHERRVVWEGGGYRVTEASWTLPWSQPSWQPGARAVTDFDPGPVTERVVERAPRDVEAFLARLAGELDAFALPDSEPVDDPYKAYLALGTAAYGTRFEIVVADAGGRTHRAKWERDHRPLDAGWVAIAEAFALFFSDAHGAARPDGAPSPGTRPAPRRSSWGALRGALRRLLPPRAWGLLRLAAGGARANDRLRAPAPPARAEPPSQMTAGSVVLPRSAASTYAPPSARLPRSPTRMNPIDVRARPSPLALKVLLPLLVAPLVLGSLFVGLTQGAVVPLGIGALAALTFGGVAWLVRRGHRMSVRSLSEDALVRNDGRRLAWADLVRVVDRVGIRPSGKRFLWRTEIRFRGGDAAWVLPAKVQNYEEVAGWVRRLPCDHVEESA